MPAKKHVRKHSLEALFRLQLLHALVLRSLLVLRVLVLRALLEHLLLHVLVMRALLAQRALSAGNWCGRWRTTRSRTARLRWQLPVAAHQRRVQRWLRSGA